MQQPMAEPFSMSNRTTAPVLLSSMSPIQPKSHRRPHHNLTLLARSTLSPLLEIMQSSSASGTVKGRQFRSAQCEALHHYNRFRNEIPSLDRGPGGR